jgi:hypothetical protein
MVIFHVLLAIFLLNSADKLESSFREKQNEAKEFTKSHFTKFGRGRVFELDSNVTIVTCPTMLPENMTVLNFGRLFHFNSIQKSLQ